MHRAMPRRSREFPCSVPCRAKAQAGGDRGDLSEAVITDVSKHCALHLVTT